MDEFTVYSPTKYNKSSSEDEIANVNVLPRQRTFKGQRLRPLTEFLISTITKRQW